MSRYLYAFTLVSSIIRHSQWVIYKVFNYNSISRSFYFLMASSPWPTALIKWWTSLSPGTVMSLNQSETISLSRKGIYRRIFGSTQSLCIGPRTKTGVSAVRNSTQISPSELLWSEHRQCRCLDTMAGPTEAGAGCDLCHHCLWSRTSVLSHFLNVYFWSKSLFWPPASESNSAIESARWIADYSAPRGPRKWILTSNLGRQILLRQGASHIKEWWLMFLSSTLSPRERVCWLYHLFTLH